MQVIRQQDRTVMPTGESPNVTLNPNMYAGEAAAAQRLAGAIQQFGGVIGDIGLKMQDAEVEREQKEFQIKVNETNQADEVFYRDNNDVVLTPEERDAKGNITKPARTSYQDQHDKSMKSLEAAASGLKYGRARKEAQQWLALNKPLLQHNTDQYIHREAVERSLGTNQAFADSIVSANLASKTDEFNSVGRKNSPGWQDLTENEYKLLQIKNANDSLVKRNFLTPVQAQTIYDKAAGELHKADIANAEGGAQAIIDNGGNVNDAQKFLDTQKLSPDEKRQQYEHASGYFNAKIDKTKQDTDAFQIQMLMDLKKNEALDPVARVKFAEEAIMKLSQVKNLSRSDFTIMEKRIDDWVNGKATGSNSDAVIEAAKIVEDLRKGLITDYAATTKMNGLRPKLSNNDYENYSISLNTKLTTRNLDFVNDTVADFEKLYPSASVELKNKYRFALEDYVNSPEGAKASPRDRYIHQKELAAEMLKPESSHFWSGLFNTMPIVAAGKIISARNKLKEAEAEAAMKRIAQGKSVFSQDTEKIVGDIVSKGGKNWKITGFTPEGKTNVEEVK